MPSSCIRPANLDLDCHPCPRTPVTHVPGLYTLREGVLAWCTSRLGSRQCHASRSHVIGAQNVANAVAGRLAGSSFMLEPPLGGGWGSGAIRPTGRRPAGTGLVPRAPDLLHPRIPPAAQPVVLVADRVLLVVVLVVVLGRVERPSQHDLG